MKKNKALTLLSTFQPSEHKKFVSVLKNNQKNKLLKLYKLLHKQLKTEKITPVETLFKQFYGEPYNSEKDYQLRNDLRYLTNEIKQFLINNHLEIKLKKEAHFKQMQLVEVLAERGLKDLYYIEWKKLFTKAKKEENYPIIVRLFEFQIDYELKNPQWSRPIFEKFLQRLDDAQVATTTLMLRKFITQEHRRIYAQATLQVLDPERDFDQHTPIHEYIQTQEKEDIFVRYTKLTSKVYYTTGAEQLETLKKALTLLPSVKLPDSQKKKAEATLNSTIGLHYFLTQVYDKALIYYEKGLKLSAFIPKGHVEAHVYNYLSTLMHSARYEEVLDKLAEHQALLMDSEMTKNRTIGLKAMCFIYLDRVAEAENCLPASIKQNSDEMYYYFRLIVVICYYLRGEWDLAFNESSNFLRMLNYKDNQLMDFQKSGSFLKQFLKIKTQTLHYPKKDHQVQFDQLIVDMQTYYKAHPRNLNLQAKWVLKMLES